MKCNLVFQKRTKKEDAFTLLPFIPTRIVDVDKEKLKYRKHFDGVLQALIIKVIKIEPMDRENTWRKDKVKYHSCRVRKGNTSRSLIWISC